MPEAMRTGKVSLKVLKPVERITVVSFVDDKEPKAISVAIRTAMGPAKVTIHAKFSVISWVMTHQLNPLPTSISMNL